MRTWAAGPSRASVGAARGRSLRSDAAALRGEGSWQSTVGLPRDRTPHELARFFPKTLARPTSSERLSARTPDEGSSMRCGDESAPLAPSCPAPTLTMSSLDRSPASSRIVGSSRVREGFPRHLATRCRHLRRIGRRPAAWSSAAHFRALASADSDVCRAGSGAVHSPTEAKPWSPGTTPRDTIRSYASHHRGQSKLSSGRDRARNITH